MMASRTSVGQLPVVLIWNYFFVTLLSGRCSTCILLNLDDELARLGYFFNHVKTRLRETIVAARVIAHNFLDGDGYYDASLIPKALSLIVGAVFLFLMKQFVVWRSVNYIMVLFFFCLQQTLTQMIIAKDRRHHRQP